MIIKQGERLELTEEFSGIFRSLGIYGVGDIREASLFYLEDPQDSLRWPLFLSGPRKLGSRQNGFSPINPAPLFLELHALVDILFRGDYVREAPIFTSPIELGEGGAVSQSGGVALVLPDKVGDDSALVVVVAGVDHMWARVFSLLGCLLAYVSLEGYDILDSSGGMLQNLILSLEIEATKWATCAEWFRAGFQEYLIEEGERSVEFYIPVTSVDSQELGFHLVLKRRNTQIEEKIAKRRQKSA